MKSNNATPHCLPLPLALFAPLRESRQFFFFIFPWDFDSNIIHLLRAWRLAFLSLIIRYCVTLLRKRGKRGNEFCKLSVFLYNFVISSVLCSLPREYLIINRVRSIAFAKFSASHFAILRDQRTSTESADVRCFIIDREALFSQLWKRTSTACSSIKFILRHLCRALFCGDCSDSTND